jgi:hypothetical protein
MNKNDILTQNLEIHFTIIESESTSVLQANFNFYLFCKITKRQNKIRMQIIFYLHSQWLNILFVKEIAAICHRFKNTKYIYEVFFESNVNSMCSEIIKAYKET